MVKTTYKSKVYTDRPEYADFNAPRKFETIKSIIARSLIEHPNAICSYSGGSDSDIMLHLIEMVRKIFNLPPIQYCFFNTGLEMDAIKRHVREMEQLYGVTITKHRPQKGIVQSTREHGIPFISKIVSSGLEGMQKKNIPLSIAAEYANAEDKVAKRSELRERYPKCESTINFLCGCNSAGEPRPDIQLVIGSSKYLLDFIIENPITFRVSNHCCVDCKKNLAHSIQKPFDMIITGERRDEGGMRSVPRKDNTASLSPEYEQKKNLEKAYIEECKEINTRLQKQVAVRAAKHKPGNPLDDLRGMRDVAKLALPELMEFVDQACDHIERLVDENEQLRAERTAAIEGIKFCHDRIDGACSVCTRHGINDAFCKRCVQSKACLPGFELHVTTEAPDERR